jgi:hypothetical protein
VRIWLRILVVAAIVLLIAPTLVSACPLCKDSKSDADYAGGTASLPSGFYYSILLMIAAPFTVVGGLALRIYLAHRRRRLAAEGGAEASDSPSGLVPDSGGARP